MASTMTGKMETLSEHNKRVGSAGVACDKCGTGMDYDIQREKAERNSIMQFETRTGRPVTCPKCGFTGRLQSGWA